MIQCPLCHKDDNTLYSKHETGEYRLCKACKLVFVLPSEHLDAQEEKERYDLHTNSPDDGGYRAYLKKVCDPVCERVEDGAFGLDFGSGPGPTLSKMFEEAGYQMNIYDPYYAKDETVLDEKYNFITSTEVIEHLYDPYTVMDRLWNMLKDEGLLILLTQPYVSQEKFASWYYKNDPTHVCFFSMETMQWLGKKWDAKLEVVGKDLFLFRKKGNNGN